MTENTETKSSLSNGLKIALGVAISLITILGFFGIKQYSDLFGNEEDAQI